MRILLIISIFLIITGCQTLSYKNSESNDFNILIIGWDGVNRNRLIRLIDEGKLLNLKKISDEGSIVSLDITTGKTDTRPGWTEILTGYEPSKTGTYSNIDYRPIPSGYTIFERIEDEFGDENITTILLSGKGKMSGAEQPSDIESLKTRFDKLLEDLEIDTLNKTLCIPFQQEDIIDKQEIMYRITLCLLYKNVFGQNIDPIKDKYKIKKLKNDAWNIYGNIFYNTQSNVDIYDNTYNYRTSDEIGESTLKYLEEYYTNRFVFLAHFSEPDISGHKYNESSIQYSEGIVTVDRWLGKIMDKLKSLGIYEKTLIYVVSDHGFDRDGYYHWCAPYTFLATNDPIIMRNADRKDITPHILDRIGIDVEKIYPRMDGRPLTDREGNPGLVYKRFNRSYCKKVLIDHDQTI